MSTSARWVQGMEGGAATRSASSVRANRWVILAGYGLLAACTQLLWLSYASITAQAHRAMAASEHIGKILLVPE